LEFKTALCELLGIDVPVLQGGMAWVATGELAAAVSEAGGLGIIGAGNAPAVFVEQEIIKAKLLTKKPFGVNLMLLSPFVEKSGWSPPVPETPGSILTNLRRKISG
jgi:enoyl-[acyl-carrier protein] reductase II